MVVDCSRVFNDFVVLCCFVEDFSFIIIVDVDIFVFEDKGIGFVVSEWCG